MWVLTMEFQACITCFLRNSGEREFGHGFEGCGVTNKIIWLSISFNDFGCHMNLGLQQSNMGPMIKRVALRYRD